MTGGNFEIVSTSHLLSFFSTFFLNMRRYGHYMDYKQITDEALYQIVKARVPEIPIKRVDDSNRNMVTAVIEITEKIRQRRESKGG